MTQDLHVKLNVLATAALKKRNIFISKLALNLRKTLVKCYAWNMAYYGAGIWTVRRGVQE
jgi:hypothetical protein